MRWQQVPSPPDQPLGRTVPAAEPTRGSTIDRLGRPRIFGRRPSRSYYIRRRKLVPFRRLDNTNNAIGLDREWILQGELALGGRVSAFLSEAVSVDAKPPGDLQRQPLQRHHVNDWSQSFIDRRRFQGNRRFETHRRGTDGKGRHADLVEGLGQLRHPLQ